MFECDERTNYMKGDDEEDREGGKRVGEMEKKTATRFHFGKSNFRILDAAAAAAIGAAAV